MLIKPEGLEKVRVSLIDQFKRAAAALEGLSFNNPNSIMAIETVDGNVIVGIITGMKYETNQLSVTVIAAKDVDFKIRNLEGKGVKKRTYPISLYDIVSSKEVEISQVPLYINFGFKSTQFKNRFFRTNP